MNTRDLNISNLIQRIALFLVLLWMATKFGVALGKGMNFTIRGFMMLPLILTAPYIAKKYGLFPLLFLLVISFWIPVTIGLKKYLPLLSELYPLEIGVWALTLYLLFQSVLTSGIRLKKTLSSMPFLFFFIFSIGAFVAHFSSNGHPGDLSRVRLIFAFPGLFCFICMYVIETEKQAETLIWWFLTSAALFGCFVFIAKSHFSIGTTIDSPDTIRLNFYLKLPLLGTISMYAAAIGYYFSILVILSFNFSLNHPSRSRRALAIIYLIIFALLVLKSQTRGALIAATMAMVFVVVLSKWQNLARQRFLFLKTAIILFLFVGYFWYSATTSTDESYYHHGMELFNNPLKAVNLISRITIWQDTIPLLKDALLGVGLFGFKVMPDGNSINVHNMYLFYFLAAGVMGLFSFMVITFLIFKSYLHYLRFNNNEMSKILVTGGLGVLFAWWIEGITSSMVHSHWGLFILWVPTCIIFSVSKFEKKIIK